MHHSNEPESQIIKEVLDNKANLNRNIDFKIQKENGEYSFILECNHSDGKTIATLAIHPKYWSKSFPAFCKEILGENERRLDYFVQWLKWAFYNHNIRTCKFDTTNFNYSTIKVYGYPNLVYPGILELEIFINGLPGIVEGELIVYRFRHMIENPLDSYENHYYPLYSYAFIFKNNTIFDKDNSDPQSSIVFFLPIQRKDSGDIRGRIDEKFRIRNLSADITIKEVDIDLLHLMSYLIESTSHLIFHSQIDLQMLRGVGDYIFGKDFSNKYTEFVDHYKKEEFSKGLQTLRVLVQEAQEIVCKKKGIPLPNRPSIVNLADSLRENDLIDENLKKWFDVVASTSNPASHKIFPIASELEDHITKDRLLLNFLIGINLIKELEKSKYHMP